MTTEQEPIGDRVSRLRRALGLNQSELARRIKKRPQSIQALEAGKIRHPGYILQLADALGVSPQYLATGSDDGSTLPDTALLRVEGIAEAGAYRDPALVAGIRPVGETVPLVRDPRFQDARQYTLYIAGDDASPAFTRGSYAICADLADLDNRPTDSMLVHVERMRDGLVETTIRRVQGGRLVVLSDKAIYAPLSADDPAVAICGVVLSRWASFGG